MDIIYAIVAGAVGGAIGITLWFILEDRHHPQKWDENVIYAEFGKDRNDRT